MAKLTIVKNGINRVFETGSGITVLDALRLAGENVYSPCGGNGTCGKCLVKVSKSAKNRLSDDFETVQACKAVITGDMTVLLDDGRMQISSDIPEMLEALSPMVQKDENANDIEYKYGNKSIYKSADGRYYGLAVDIGTTTVAVYICDCVEGKVTDVGSFKNPQAVYGSDVISRMDKIAKDAKVLAEEKRILVDEINKEINRLCKKNGIDKNLILSAAFCGNTVMEHIFAGIDPVSISVYPFTPKTLFDNTYCSSEELGIDINKNAVCMFAPCFASYVGGDIACGIISENLDSTKENIIFLDVGTNGEVGLCTDGKMYFCSSAAGPAFEGANIKYGVPGIEGAISEVTYDSGVKYKTIGGKKPVGICGSGLIDAVSIMVKNGIIDETGAFESKDKKEFTICDSIAVTEKDVREVQLAKSAVCSGILTLMHKAGLKEKDITKVYVAGGFGAHINPESACGIGLIPKSLNDRIEFVGNTAGKGAVRLVLQEDARTRIQKLKEKSQYIELSTDSFFMDCFIEQMEF